MARLKTIGEMTVCPKVIYLVYAGSLSKFNIVGYCAEDMCLLLRGQRGWYVDHARQYFDNYWKARKYGLEHGMTVEAEEGWKMSTRNWGRRMKGAIKAEAATR